MAGDVRPPFLVLALAWAAVASGCAPAARASADIRIAPSLTSPEAAERWEYRNPGSWSVREGALVLHTAGKPEGPIRKPAEWAILRGEPLGDVVVSLEARADAPVSRMGRDVLIFFGYQSPTRFYYAHLSNETTHPHNGIFLVNDADRVRLDDGRAVPRLMDADWHRLRLERDVRSGRIAVYLDDGADPILQASDTTLTSGRVGVGSFDDPASFRAIEVRGSAVASSGR